MLTELVFRPSLILHGLQLAISAEPFEGLHALRFPAVYEFMASWAKRHHKAVLLRELPPRLTGYQMVVGHLSLNTAPVADLRFLVELHAIAPLRYLPAARDHWTFPFWVVHSKLLAALLDLSKSR